MKNEDGYVLLRSLITAAVILICVAAFFFTLAMAERQSGHLERRIEEEMSFRKSKITERLK